MNVLEKETDDYTLRLLDEEVIRYVLQFIRSDIVSGILFSVDWNAGCLAA